MTTPTLFELQLKVSAAQRKLKKLGVVPPPPSGAKALADIMKPGRRYTPPKALAPTKAYLAQLTNLLTQSANRWTDEAYLHNVMAAALEAAPPPLRPNEPHGHVPARPVIGNEGYLALSLLAAEWVTPHVSSKERASFDRWVALGKRVSRGLALTAKDRALFNRELPYVRLPSRAISRVFTAKTPALLVAQGVGLEAEQTHARNVGGKGAREACARAVKLLGPSPKTVTAFLQALDATILLESAKVQLGDVKEQPSSAPVACRWRGAEGGKVIAFLVELADGHFALVWKLKGTWRLVEGERDAVLATVPDAHFASATRALLG